MMDCYQLISISHQKLDTEDLDRFMIRHHDKRELKTKLQLFKSEFGFDELLYLSTCNRLMILVYHQSELDYNDIVRILSWINPDIHKEIAHRVEKFVDFYRGEDCVRHLFEVACSLKSLVIGEREIFRQFRAAYAECKSCQLTGDHIRLIEKCTVAAAKDVYTSTSIGEKAVSIVSLALQRLLNMNPNRKARVLMIGSGETNSTFARFLRKHGFENIVIFNRSLDNARKLSEEIGAQAYHLSDLDDYKDGFDIMICSTASTEPIIKQHTYRWLVGNEDTRKILIDLSIPNNISRDIASNREALIINIDSLRALADKNLQQRRGNIAASRILINYHLDNFTVMFDQRQIEKAFSKLPSEIKSIKERAMDKVFKEKIDELPDDTKQLLLEMMDYMEKKCVAAPIKMAKKIISK